MHRNGLIFLPRDGAGFDCVMIIADYFPKFTVLSPFKSTYSSSETANLFKIDKGFGVPSVIIGDRDAELTSKFLDKALRRPRGVSQPCHQLETIHVRDRFCRERLRQLPMIVAKRGRLKKKRIESQPATKV